SKGRDVACEKGARDSRRATIVGEAAAVAGPRDDVPDRRGVVRERTVGDRQRAGVPDPGPSRAARARAGNLDVGARAALSDQGALVVDRPEEVQAKAKKVVADLVAGDRDVIECQVALVPDGVVGRPGEGQPGDGRRDAGVDGEVRGAAGKVVGPAGAGE